MLKKLLSFFVLTLCIVGDVSATVIPSPLYNSGRAVGAGTFYFYNIGANRFLSRGTDWDTHAVLDGAGLPIVSESFGDGGSLKTGINGGYVFFNEQGEVYIDGTQTAFRCDQVTVSGYTNAYTLSGVNQNGQRVYLGWAGGGAGERGNAVVTATSASSNNFYWLLISPDDRKFDVTNYITNPDFERWGEWTQTFARNKYKGWTTSGFQVQNNGSATDIANAVYAEKWASSAPLGGDNIHQNVTNLPRGIYTISVSAAATNNGATCTKGVTLFLGDQSTPIGAAGTYQVTTTLPNGGSLDMGIGINSDNDANWVRFDNVRLYREDIATYNKSGNTLQFTGVGRLEDKVFNMNDYTVILGNENNDGEVPYVRYLDNPNEGLVAYVKGSNGSSFAGYDNNLPTGSGSYYTIKPSNDGKLKVYVRGYNSNYPLIMIDSNGGIRKVIPGAEYTGGVTEIDCGCLLGGNVYYLYTRGSSTLFLQKTEFTTISSLYQNYGSGFNIVEMNDFDQYSESIGQPQPQHVWVAHQSIDCIVAVDEVAGNTHGPYAKYALDKAGSGGNNTNDRAVYYPFEQLGSRKRYVIEFDANVNPGTENNSQIAIYRSLPNANKWVTDYILSIMIPADGSNWEFFVDGANEAVLDANLSINTWYHFIVEVDARDEQYYQGRLQSKIGIKVTADNNHSNVIAQTEYWGQYGSVYFLGDYKAKGLYYLAGRYNNEAKFDNILISSNQGSMGSLTAPTIAVTGFNGNSRDITVTSGYSDAEQNYTVKTYYQYTTDTSNTWTNILNSGSWSNWTSFDAPKSEQPKSHTFNLTGTTKTVYIVRAISTITDYATVQSDTAYLRVVVGEPWTLTGGFAVQEMKQESDGYYTPRIRAYADTGILGSDISKVIIKLQYLPLDYGIDASTGEFVEQNFIELCNDNATNNNLFTTTDGITYYDFDVPRSGIYLLHVSGTGFLPGTVSKYYYKDKYKVTYQTPDFAASTPLTEFEQNNISLRNANKDEVLNRIYGYTGWNNWQMVQTPFEIDGWNNSAITADYIWNYSYKGTTATLNSVTSARSAASSQTYDIRTIQYDVTNPLILRNGWGIVKDSDAPWNYRCGLAHIGMGNDIPEFTIDLGKGNQHDIKYVYPTPYIVSSKNVPQCDYSVPARAALKQYKVYTPVEVKYVNGASGLASFSSYYDYYHVQDYFLEGDELVDTYCSRDNYAFGGEYLLMQTWYAEARQGWLLAATQYRGTNIWDGYASFASEDPWGGNTKKVELKILDGVGEGYWPKHNELQPVLFNDETQDHSAHKLTIYGSSNGDANGRPNQILYKGTRNGQTAYNFYCLPTATTEAKMANKTAYIQRQKCTYAQYLASQSSSSSSVKESGNIFIFSNGEENGEVVGIDMVENNASFSTVDDGAFYTLSGQKVSTPTKGLYIHNGKKVLVK